jgi:hypothetical protein
MAKQKKGKLLVRGDGARRYITVPVGRANALHTYLRGHKVSSAPPEPAFTGFDSIELAKGIDVAGVQTLLNAWG